MELRGQVNRCEDGSVSNWLLDIYLFKGAVCIHIWPSPRLWVWSLRLLRQGYVCLGPFEITWVARLDNA
jgi:hypothetical protein